MMKFTDIWAPHHTNLVRSNQIHKELLTSPVFGKNDVKSEKKNSIKSAQKLYSCTTVLIGRNDQNTSSRVWAACPNFNFTAKPYQI